MKLLFIMPGFILLLGMAGCSPAKEETPKSPVKKETPEEAARRILNNRAIVREQGDLTKEELENAKNVIASPQNTDVKKRTIVTEQGGPPAPEGKSRKEAEAQRHIDTK